MDYDQTYFTLRIDYGLTPNEAADVLCRAETSGSASAKGRRIAITCTDGKFAIAGKGGLLYARRS